MPTPTRDHRGRFKRKATMENLGEFFADLLHYTRTSRDINPHTHPDPDRDIWNETIQATGFNPDYDH